MYPFTGANLHRRFETGMYPASPVMTDDAAIVVLTTQQSCGPDANSPLCLFIPAPREQQKHKYRSQSQKAYTCQQAKVARDETDDTWQCYLKWRTQAGNRTYCTGTSRQPGIRFCLREREPASSSEADDEECTGSKLDGAGSQQADYSNQAQQYETRQQPLRSDRLSFEEPRIRAIGGFPTPPRELTIHKRSSL